MVLEDVEVPVENLIGKENKGFGPIMNNFNHERSRTHQASSVHTASMPRQGHGRHGHVASRHRWTIVIGALASSRCILRECVLWANQRKVFGKALITQPVVMAKIAEMAVTRAHTQHAYTRPL